MSNQWFNSKIGRRNLIKKVEDRVSYLQIIGLMLMGSGICYLTVFRIYKHVTSPDGLAISFFIIMLGFAFAFPSLLKGRNAGLSTMRIVVFLMINLIGMLLLKFGWQSKTFIEIGINGYLVGTIAIIFAAKALQSFFESRAARNFRTIQPIQEQKPVPEVWTRQEPVKAIEETRLAIQQQGPALMQQFKNIVKLLPSYCPKGSARVPCIDVCLSDEQKNGIPGFITYQLKGQTSQIKTRIILNFGVAKPQVGRGDFIANVDFEAVVGTVACTVQDDKSNVYLLTCNHVLNGGAFAAPADLGAQVAQVAGGSYVGIGSWTAGEMSGVMDAALVQLDNPDYADPNDLQLPTYPVSDSDQGNTQVGLIGGRSGLRGGYIIHINESFPFVYQDQTVEISNLTSLSSSTIESDFVCITDDGDSGSLVYNSHTRQPIGMIVGANAQFSLAIPIDSVLKAFPNYNLSINA